VSEEEELRLLGLELVQKRTDSGNKNIEGADRPQKETTMSHDSVNVNNNNNNKHATLDQKLDFIAEDIAALRAALVKEKRALTRNQKIAAAAAATTVAVVAVATVVYHRRKATPPTQG
jgi:hypothetical protein